MQYPVETKILCSDESINSLRGWEVEGRVPVVKGYWYLDDECGEVPYYTPKIYKHSHYKPILSIKRQ